MFQSQGGQTEKVCPEDGQRRCQKNAEDGAARQEVQRKEERRFRDSAEDKKEETRTRRTEMG